MYTLLLLSCHQMRPHIRWSTLHYMTTSMCRNIMYWIFEIFHIEAYCVIFVTLFGLLMSHFVTPIKVQLTWVTSWWKYNICHIVYILIIAVWRCMSYYIAVINVTKCDDRPCNICHTAPNCLEYFLTLQCIALYLDFVLNLYNRRGFSKEKVIIASSSH